MHEHQSWGLYTGWASSYQDILRSNQGRITPGVVEGFFRQYWRGEYNISADYSPISGFNVASTMSLDINVGDVTITYVNYLKMVCLLESGLGGMNNNINGTWMGIYSSLSAAGFSMGVKNLMIEGGAASYSGTRISKVNNTSIIRTYGVAGARYLKYSRGLGVAVSVVSTGYSGYKVYEQYNKGGANEVFKHRDVWDAGFGAVGLGATGLAAFGIISNPVGWGIGKGVLIYGGVTLIYDAVNND